MFFFAWNGYGLKKPISIVKKFYEDKIERLKIEMDRQKREMELEMKEMRKEMEMKKSEIATLKKSEVK